MQYSADEYMVVSISRQIDDGEVVVQGLATPLVAAAYLLAKHTHAPNIYFASAIGQSLCRESAPLGLTTVEKLWIDKAMTDIGFISVAADFLPTLKPKEYFRPAQVDQHGNFNNIAFGSDYQKPRLRLPGTGGIPDVTTYLDNIYLYVPRHSRVTFVEKLDYLSGLGHSPHRLQGSGTRALISDFGCFDFLNGRMRLVSYHPMVTPERIQARTGFELDIPSEVAETPAPSDEEIRLLRERIDPLGIRRLETLSGSNRKRLLAEILTRESEAAYADH
jgi:acyl CoA:acetate/3-ketoacid CoA transferase beta subunit